MRLRALIIAGLALLTVAPPAAAAERASVAPRVAQTGHRVIDHDRVIELLRARHIRYIGQPFLDNGRYVIRCYDDLAQLSYCFVDPHSGEFLGVSLHL